MSPWILMALLGVGCPFLLTWLSFRLTRRSSRRVRRVAALCASALGVLLGIGLPGEWMLRGNYERPYERTFPGQFENDPAGVTWADPDPELGWVCSR